MSSLQPGHSKDLARRAEENTAAFWYRYWLRWGFRFDEKKNPKNSVLNMIKVSSSLISKKSSNRKYWAVTASHRLTGPCSYHLVPLPCVPKANSWSTIAARAPAIAAEFQQIGSEKERHLSQRLKACP